MLMLSVSFGLYSCHVLLLFDRSMLQIMASRICVEEVNRLRQNFRPDLPCYQLPPKKSVKRKMTGVNKVPQRNKNVTPVNRVQIKSTSAVVYVIPLLSKVTI